MRSTNWAKRARVKVLSRFELEIMVSKTIVITNFTIRPKGEPGFEPGTYWTAVNCSTPELLTQVLSGSIQTCYDLLPSIQTCYDLFYTCSQPFILNRERYHIDILLYIVNVLKKINQLNKSEMLVSFIGKYLNNGALRISSSSKYFIWGYLKNIIAENWKPRKCICP